MVDTVIQKILDRVETDLSTITGLPGGVHQTTVDPFSKERSPGINIYPSNDSPIQQTIDYILWNSLVRIAIVGRGMKPADIANQFAQAVHQRIIALGADNAFDTPVLVQYVSPSNVQYDLMGGDGDIGVVTRDYIFQYTTRYDDLTVSG